MKPIMHLVEISIFSLNNVTVSLTKIMNNLLERHFLVLKIGKIIQKKILWRILDQETNFY